MKKAILMAVMVSVSIIATAQTFDEPTYYNDVYNSNPYEWFMIDDDTTIVMIYGDDIFMDELSKEWFDKYGLDINRPEEVEKDKKFNTKIWYVDYEKGGHIKIALYDNNVGKTLIVGTIPD